MKRIKYLILFIIFIVSCKEQKKGETSEEKNYLNIQRMDSIMLFEKFDWFNLKGVNSKLNSEECYPFVKVRSLEGELKLDFVWSSNLLLSYLINLDGDTPYMRSSYQKEESPYQETFETFFLDSVIVNVRATKDSYYNKHYINSIEVQEKRYKFKKYIFSNNLYHYNEFAIDSYNQGILDHYDNLRFVSDKKYFVNGNTLKVVESKNDLYDGSKSKYVDCFDLNDYDLLWWEQFGQYFDKLNCDNY